MEREEGGAIFKAGGEERNGRRDRRPAGRPSMEAIQGGLNPVNQDQIEREKMEEIKRRRRGTDFCN